MSVARLEEWVAKAEQDYRAAMTLNAADTPDVICFHCQQCIEKYLKAAMAGAQVPIRKSHDLVGLNELLSARDPRFLGLSDRLEPLEAHAVGSRYPGIDATAEEAQTVRVAMEELRAAIRELMDLGIEQAKDDEAQTDPEEDPGQCPN